MNKDRYPDFKGMVGLFHRAGMKVVPNVKPCESTSATHLIIQMLSVSILRTRSSNNRMPCSSTPTLEVLLSKTSGRAEKANVKREVGSTFHPLQVARGGPRASKDWSTSALTACGSEPIPFYIRFHR